MPRQHIPNVCATIQLHCPQENVINVTDSIILKAELNIMHRQHIVSYLDVRGFEFFNVYTNCKKTMHFSFSNWPKVDEGEISPDNSHLFTRLIPRNQETLQVEFCNDTERWTRAEISNIVNIIKTRFNLL